MKHVCTKHKWLLACLLASSFFCLSAATTQTTFSVFAPVLAALRVTTKQDLNFGEHGALKAGNFVASTPAIIEARGNPNAAITGSFVNSNVQMTCQTSARCGTNSMLVDTFTCSGTGISSNCSGNLGSNGTVDINISATMHESASDKAGTYQGQQTFELVYS